MHTVIRWSVGAAIALAIARGTMNAPSVASAHPSDRARDVAAAARSDKDRNLYQVTPLVSDGSIDAPFHDPNLRNSWGIARGVSGPFWVADNHADVATLYDGNGVANPLVVSLPSGTGPTGIVFNPGGGFIVNDGTNSGPARFLFATEDGRIFGWNPGVPPPSPSRTAFQLNTDGLLTVIYKGIALASTAGGQRLYVTDFHNRVVDVFDEAVQPVRLGPDAFVDPNANDRNAYVFGGTLLVWDPAGTMRQAIQDAGTSISDVTSLDAGSMGGELKCANGKDDKRKAIVICAWVDHGSVGIGVFYGGRSMLDSAAFLRALRAAIIIRP